MREGRKKQGNFHVYADVIEWCQRHKQMLQLRFFLDIIKCVCVHGPAHACHSAFSNEIARPFCDYGEHLAIWDSWVFGLSALCA